MLQLAILSPIDLIAFVVNAMFLTLCLSSYLIIFWLLYKWIMFVIQIPFILTFVLRMRNRVKVYLTQMFVSFRTDVTEESGQRCDVSKLRESFRSQVLKKSTPSAHNPHAISAAERSGVDRSIAEFATKHGLTEYSVSCSPKDMRRGVAGSRISYFEKDLRIPTKQDPIPPNALIKSIDVDYYLEEEELTDLIFAAPVLQLYTIVPDDLATTTEDTLMVVNADGSITQTHAGCNPYSHSLWDWSVDYVTVFDCPWGVPTRMRHCYVDSIEVSKNRRLVQILPVFTTGFWGSILWYFTGSVKALTRWRPTNVNGVNILPKHDGVFVAHPSSRVSHYLTNVQYSELIHITSDVTSPSVCRVIGSDTHAYDLVSIVKLLRVDPQPLPPPKIFSRLPRSYKAEFSDVHDDDIAKPKGQTMFPPIVDSAFCPVSALSDDLACLSGRLTAPQSKLKPIPEEYVPLRKQFVAKLAATIGRLVPIGVQDVIENASSSQKKKYEQAAAGKPDLENKAFQKTEAYPAIKHPRNISAVDPKHVVKYSCYTQPLSAALKIVAPWYSFGVHPSEVARRVADISERADGILVEGDFSAYDGTQSSFHVTLVLDLLLAVYPPETHDEIRELTAALSYCMFKTEHKVRYCKNDTEASGSADTSVANTIRHAFAQYAHFRRLGGDRDISYRKIGMCAGDDGLLRTPNPSHYEQTCADLGFVLKCTPRQPADPVGFLGRYWPVHGSIRNFADPMRTLSKFHFSDCSDRKMDVNTLAWRKAAGYYVTDAGNFIGHISQKILEITGKGKTDVVERREWLKHILPENSILSTAALLERFKDGPVYPTYESDPKTLMTPEGNYDPCFLMFVQQTQKNISDVFQWYKRFMSISQLSEVPPLMKVEAVSALPYPVSVDGVVIGPKLSPAPRPPKPAPPVCNSFFRNKKCPRKNCNFRHDISKICHKFAIGKCSFAKCKFEHVPLSVDV